MDPFFKVPEVQEKLLWTGFEDGMYRSSRSESDECVCEISGIKNWRVDDVTCTRMLLCNKELLPFKRVRQGLSARMLR